MSILSFSYHILVGFFYAQLKPLVLQEALCHHSTYIILSHLSAVSYVSCCNHNFTASGESHLSLQLD